MSVALAVQKGIRDRLVAYPPLVLLVPAGNIVDANARPAPDPSIVIGEDQEVDEDRVARDVVRVYSTLHVWKKEAGLVGVKKIAGAVRTLINAYRIELPAPFVVADCFVPSTRFLRDPDKVTAHGVITIETLVGGA